MKNLTVVYQPKNIKHIFDNDSFQDTPSWQKKKIDSSCQELQLLWELHFPVMWSWYQSTKDFSSNDVLVVLILWT